MSVAQTEQPLYNKVVHHMNEYYSERRPSNGASPVNEWYGIYATNQDAGVKRFVVQNWAAIKKLLESPDRKVEDLTFKNIVRRSKKDRDAQQKEQENVIRNEMQQFLALSENEVDALIANVASKAETKLRNFFKTRVLKVSAQGRFSESETFTYEKAVAGTGGLIEWFAYYFPGGSETCAFPGERLCTMLMGSSGSVQKLITEKITADAAKKSGPLAGFSDPKKLPHHVKQQIIDKSAECGWPRKIGEMIQSEFSRSAVIEYLRANKHYAGIMDAFLVEMQQRERLHEAIIRSMPSSYPAFFPETRMIRRHFVLNLGPTNSGKTYQAVEALRQSDNGIYLAPLRLLAYEQYETLNQAGCPCRLLTGEEEIDVPGARCQSSTIEMLDVFRKYDVAVIDEGQMLYDDARGGAWTNAVVGVQANTVYVCGSENAQDILVRLIEECGDTYEVHHFERFTPLEMDPGVMRFPKDVRPGDALVAFSRIDVHSAAEILKKKGFSTAVLYGALPYDVRHEEARRFASGEASVVVTTDVIGMGVNMPIKRVVFLSSEKFDGKTRRPLRAGEIQQIAGRAGRYGQFDKGRVACLDSRKHFLKALETELPSIPAARLSFPAMYAQLDGKLSDIMKQWSRIPVSDNYIREDISDQITLCERGEWITDDKALVYAFATIPFDIKSDELNRIWNQLFHYTIGKSEKTVEFLRGYLEKDTGGKDLNSLELLYKVMDLLYHYCRKFSMGDLQRALLEKKLEISRAITQILKDRKYSPRVCRSCRRLLPFGYRYGYCEKCYESLYGWRDDYCGNWY